MSLVTRGAVLLVAHLLLMSSLGAKLLIDRATRPRVWVETTPYDPDLPIRGRYVSLRLVVDAPGIPAPTEEEVRSFIPAWRRGTLEVMDDRLVLRVVPDETDADLPSIEPIRRDGEWIATLREPVAYFIPEHVEDPSRRPPGESLWVEVTLPREGPPRPIRLGVRRGDGPIEPLPLD